MADSSSVTGFFVHQYDYVVYQLGELYTRSRIVAEWFVACQSIPSAIASSLVAFSCQRRAFCPSCGARRMAESAVLLADEVFPEQRLSLAPKPRVNLTRFHGAFAPNRKHCARGTPACSASARVGRNGLIE
jgi:hypothetical protein